MQGRDHPVQILCAIAGVISVMVVVTVFISTVTFLRNKKSNKVLPGRRVRRRSPRQRQSWAFRNPFRKRRNPGDTFAFKEEAEPAAENVNRNNNVADVHRHRYQPPAPPPPPPPRAPALPPPGYGCPRPGDRPRAVPSVSAAVAAKPKRKLFRDREDSLNVALVSELKMRLEQKRMQSRY